METITVLGLEIAYERRGRGTPVLLLHGGVSDHREWRRQVDALAGEFDLVAWDAPGNGASDDPPPDWRLPEYADCLAGLAHALELHRPHVVGLSFGTTVALELYRGHPDLPRSLSLLGAYAGWAGSLPPEVVAERLAGVERDLAISTETLARNWLPTLLTEDAPAEVEDELLAIMAALHPAGARTMARAIAEADLRDVLPTIAVPTLLLYGDADVRSPLDVAEAMHAAIPGSTLTVFPGAPHMLNMEAAEAVNEALLAFLRETLRVFELNDDVVELPTAWARPHAQVEVELRKTDGFGLAARLVGDDDEHLLSFPWHDHVDRLLRRRDRGGLPVDLPDDGWDELEQGWWGRVIPVGLDVYIAETDFDALLDASDRTLALVQPGLVRAGDVEIRWSRVTRTAYDAAWQRVIAR